MNEELNVVQQDISPAPLPLVTRRIIRADLDTQDLQREIIERAESTGS
jgi:hypothetical protein